MREPRLLCAVPDFVDACVFGDMVRAANVHSCPHPVGPRALCLLSPPGWSFFSPIQPSRLCYLCSVFNFVGLFFE